MKITTLVSYGNQFCQWPVRLGFNPGFSHTKDTKKWYLIPSCLILIIVRYVSRVKWSNPGKGVAPSPTSQHSSYWKRSLQVTLDHGHQLHFFLYMIIIVGNAHSEHGSNPYWNLSIKMSLKTKNNPFLGISFKWNPLVKL